MAYSYDRFLPGVNIDDTEMRVRDALTTEGFGVLTEIDVQKTLKEKIGEEINSYRILGACNPNMAFQAIGLEPRIGTMLPCNIVIRSCNGGTEINAVDPILSMLAIDNPDLSLIAGKVREMLRRAIDAA